MEYIDTGDNIDSGDDIDRDDNIDTQDNRFSKQIRSMEFIIFGASGMLIIHTYFKKKNAAAEI
jgi:hypothetical protein